MFLFVAACNPTEILKGITEIICGAVTIFNAVEGGTESATFSARKSSYNVVLSEISRVQTLLGEEEKEVSSGDNDTAKIFSRESLASVADFTSNKIDSATALKELSSVIRAMRDKDKKEGLTAEEVKVLQLYVDDFVEEARQYEELLEETK